MLSTATNRSFFYDLVHLPLHWLVINRSIDAAEVWWIRVTNTAKANVKLWTDNTYWLQWRQSLVVHISKPENQLPELAANFQNLFPFEGGIVALVHDQLCAPGEAFQQAIYLYNHIEMNLLDISSAFNGTDVKSWSVCALRTIFCFLFEISWVTIRLG